LFFGDFSIFNFVFFQLSKDPQDSSPESAESAEKLGIFPKKTTKNPLNQLGDEIGEAGKLRSKRSTCFDWAGSENCENECQAKKVSFIGSCKILIFVLFYKIQIHLHYFRIRTLENATAPALASGQ
jgi:hypothetical protein